MRNYEIDDLISISSDKVVGLSSIMAAKYGLPNATGLNDALVNLLIFKKLCQTEALGGGSPSKIDASLLRSECTDLISSARRIMNMASDGGLSAALLTVSRVQDISVLLHTIRSVMIIANHKGFIEARPNHSMVPALMMPLALFWGESTCKIPSAQFHGLEEGYAPIAGTCSAFIADCLKGTGWAFPNAELASNYRTMQESVLEFFELNGVPVEYDEAPGENS